MSDQHSQRAKEILQSILYATVATASKDGKPWNSPVAKWLGPDMAIYWFSDKDSVHSVNIRANEAVFIAIYDSTMPEGTGEGIYIEATASEINDPRDIDKIAALQTGEWKVTPEQVSGEAIHRFYKAVPKTIWMNDVENDTNGNYIRDIRVEVQIE